MSIDCQDQDEYEKMCARGENAQFEAIYQAELAAARMTAEQVLDELYDCREELQLTLDELDQGEMALQKLGLLIWNVRKAASERQTGAVGALSAQEAAMSAVRGVAI